MLRQKTMSEKSFSADLRRHTSIISQLFGAAKSGNEVFTRMNKEIEKRQEGLSQATKNHITHTSENLKLATKIIDYLARKYHSTKNGYFQGRQGLYRLICGEDPPNRIQLWSIGYGLVLVSDKPKTLDLPDLTTTLRYNRDQIKKHKKKFKDLNVLLVNTNRKIETETKHEEYSLATRFMYVPWNALAACLYPYSSANLERPDPESIDRVAQSVTIGNYVKLLMDTSADPKELAFQLSLLGNSADNQSCLREMVKYYSDGTINSYLKKHKLEALWYSFTSETEEFDLEL